MLIEWRKNKMIKEKIINFLENGYLANILTIVGVFVAYLTFRADISQSHLAFERILPWSCVYVAIIAIYLICYYSWEFLTTRSTKYAKLKFQLNNQLARKDQ